ncbi:hypothetical protein SAMN06266787_1192 [Halorubrum ezzemoulense]|uniref:Uncharacterized protein n=1 Tax=Halorubrum ezzemoulense TaxID=337243 RepID=A0A238YT36_HALEZ|nr:hypothetical protein SAMN06266787_1192 [Halorubrum ezzemoulense]
MFFLDNFAIIVFREFTSISKNIEGFSSVTMFLCGERSRKRNYIIGESSFAKRILTMAHNFAELVCVVGRKNKLTLLETTQNSLIQRIFK